MLENGFCSWYQGQYPFWCLPFTLMLAQHCSQHTFNDLILLLFVYSWKELVDCQVRTSVGWFFGVNNGSLPVFRLDIYRFSIPGDYLFVKPPPPKLTWKINKSWYLHLEPTQQKKKRVTHPWNQPSKNVKCQRTWK
jgi:hypothetical protein